MAVSRNFALLHMPELQKMIFSRGSTVSGTKELKTVNCSIDSRVLEELVRFGQILTIGLD